LASTNVPHPSHSTPALQSIGKALEASPYRRFKARLQNYWNLLTHLGWEELRSGVSEAVVRANLFIRWSNAYNHMSGEHEHCLPTSPCRRDGYVPTTNSKPLTEADKEPFVNVIFAKLKVRLASHNDLRKLPVLNVHHACLFLHYSLTNCASSYRMTYCSSCSPACFICRVTRTTVWVGLTASQKLVLTQYMILLVNFQFFVLIDSVSSCP
jgi:hypothetical protein